MDTVALLMSKTSQDGARCPSNEQRQSVIIGACAARCTVDREIAFLSSTIHGTIEDIALQRVLNKNPVLAGRLRPTWPTGGPRPEGLEIGFEGPVGLHFQVRPLSADMEHQVERLDAEGDEYARQFLQIHTEFADSLGVARVGYGLNLLGKDRPLCMASYCPGAQVSVVALSVSRILGDSAVQALFRAWDEEFQEPDLSAKSVSSREVRLFPWSFSWQLRSRQSPA
ncbi:Uncharacterized protein SCF082_LOCUS35589 [Durusdinium trenchii]|uniref:Uncharacterized protein n=1 Tax=Durusdinium trenchii TaxID=1381693 RepID=A0ABP0P975_9DINO